MKNCPDGQVRSELCLHHGHAFVAAAEKTCCMQRSRVPNRSLWSPEICYNTVPLCSAVVLCDCMQTNEHLSRLQLLATVGWKCGCQPFSCPRSQKCDATAERRLVRHVCLRNPLPPYSFWQFASMQSLPEAWRCLRATVSSTSSAL